MKWAYLIGFSVASLFFFVAGTINFAGSISFSLKGIRTEGIVIQIKAEDERDNGGRYHTYYSPIVQFQTADGKTFRFRSSRRTVVSYFKEGDKLPVVYLANNPGEARLHNNFEMWIVPAILLFFSAGLAFVGRFSYRALNSAGKTFDTPFFAHRKEKPGRFIRVTATVEQVHFSGSADRPMLAFELSWSDPRDKKIHSLTTQPTSYKVNGKYVSEEVARAFVRRKVSLTFDPKNENSNHLDLRELLGPERKVA